MLVHKLLLFAFHQGPQAGTIDRFHELGVEQTGEEYQTVLAGRQSAR
jgi:hypothetical protein